MSQSDHFIYRPPQEPLNILHEDRDIVVVNKPSGLLSVSSRRHLDSVEFRLKERYKEKQPNLQVYVIHRLDMDTSGIIVFALRKKAERELKIQFMERKVQKEYQAIVLGHVSEPSFLIDIPLVHQSIDFSKDTKPLSQVCFDRGKPAKTKVAVLCRGRDSTLIGDWTHVRLSPLTGRSHQLRVHMKHLGHPILGDRFYGGVVSPKNITDDRTHILYLHAQKLHFQHPYNKKNIILSTPEPFGLFFGN